MARVKKKIHRIISVRPGNDLCGFHQFIKNGHAKSQSSGRHENTGSLDLTGKMNLMNELGILIFWPTGI
jgi:hypothetical protein